METPLDTEGIAKHDACMETEKLLWDWILQTLFSNDNFDVTKIGHLIPLSNLVDKIKCFVSNFYFKVNTFLKELNMKNL